MGFLRMRRNTKRRLTCCQVSFHWLLKTFPSQTLMLTILVRVDFPPAHTHYNLTKSIFNVSGIFSKLNLTGIIVVFKECVYSYWAGVGIIFLETCVMFCIYLLNKKSALRWKLFFIVLIMPFQNTSLSQDCLFAISLLKGLEHVSSPNMSLNSRIIGAMDQMLHVNNEAGDTTGTIKI